MSNGWFKLQRKDINSELWLSEKFTKGQAWVDLQALANYENGYVLIRGIKVDLKKGDVGWSQTNLAKRWKWSRKKVSNFYAFLEAENMITRVLKRSKNVTAELSKKEPQKEPQKELQKEPQINKVFEVISIVNYNVDENENRKKDSKKDSEKNRSISEKRTAEEPQKNPKKKNKKEKKEKKATKKALCSPEHLKKDMLKKNLHPKAVEWAIFKASKPGVRNPVNYAVKVAADESAKIFETEEIEKNEIRKKIVPDKNFDSFLKDIGGEKTDSTKIDFSKSKTRKVVRKKMTKQALQKQLIESGEL